MHTKEQRLAKALKKGDEAALGKIIDGYAGYVCAVIRNFSRGAFTEEDIDEICSDVFFSLWEHREGLDEELGLKAYLSATARNAVKNRFRSAKPAAVDIDELELADGFSVERKAELNELMRELDKLIKALPDEEREIFMRFYFYGQKSSEIAEITDTAEGTVRSRLSRTRAKLREELRSRGFDYEELF
ncbi:MAG: sigma-70 family RNA polymerase sigma factor [Lachnospiraceae bacterium]|nr:sigma-70 family RNA polymerase sigma factor [Ruminococcus sp.]MCM1275984.1 sigma-70 family RNA polymerase sigma factor [Lachnospiraceae bacterium]